jgi:hypothetical protein|tara:strand:+ start:346 stop:576 length:231 start_codon:yes stop_codon:yes gene_type:complete
MDIEEQSVEFLSTHIETSFQGLMERYVIESVEWMEMSDDSAHAVAYLADPTVKDMKCNIVCLFPPFFPNNLNNKNR